MTKALKHYCKTEKIYNAYGINKPLPLPQFRQFLPQSFRSIAMPWETQIKTPGWNQRKEH